MRFLEQLPEAWQEQWQASGFNEPSTIQEKSFTPLREGENVLGISPTGTGKTLAYMLPLLLTVEKGQGNQLLIIAPSQELAMQIAEVARTWAKPLQLTVQTLIGGANVSRQIDKLKKTSRSVNRNTRSNFRVNEEQKSQSSVVKNNCNG